MSDKPVESGANAFPMCPPHESIFQHGNLSPTEGCIICIRNERDELLELLAPLVPEGELADSVNFLRELIARVPSSVKQNTDEAADWESLAFPGPSWNAEDKNSALDAGPALSTNTVDKDNSPPCCPHGDSEHVLRYCTIPDCGCRRLNPDLSIAAFHRGVNAAKDAIRDEVKGEAEDNPHYYAATFINAIARKCGIDRAIPMKDCPNGCAQDAQKNDEDYCGICAEKLETSDDKDSSIPPAGFMPIATAPKNATWVQALLKNHSIVEAHWAQDYSGEHQAPFDGWFDRRLVELVDAETPTHWKPLSITESSPVTPPLATQIAESLFIPEEQKEWAVQVIQEHVIRTLTPPLAKPYKDHLRESLKTIEDFVGYLSACHDEGSETFKLGVKDVLEFRYQRGLETALLTVGHLGGLDSGYSGHYQNGYELAKQRMEEAIRSRISEPKNQEDKNSNNHEHDA